ncbi:hypothetical protein G4V62_12205 [Bacillaceae bacterium SIJ1]|uniref:CdaR family protein n=1 Tax=Litoribacterium kuwaitense TaxID=1398745 RepID=UPI0013EA22B6|nr:CdaR family protein [Litoribacterium kuwaitense]NGP45681.1 hypothetical protein [Litoribacterium kuwaitense]
MDKMMNTPWFVKIVALFLAVLLYLIVTTETTPGENNNDNVLPRVSESEEISVPIATHSDGEQYVVSDEAQTADVYIEGPTSVIRATLNQRDFEVFVDVTDLAPGTHLVDVQHSGFSSRLDVSVDPAQIEVTIEPKVSNVYQVSVDYINEQAMAEGYSAGDAILKPEAVRVTGPQSEIEQIALVKTLVDLTGVSEDVDTSSLVKVYDGRGNELDVTVEPSTIDVTVPVASPEKTVSIEAVGSGEAAEGFQVTDMTPVPEQVTVSGAKELLDTIDRIQTEGVNIDGLDASETIEAGLALPEGITAEEETVDVEVTVEEVSESTVELEDVAIQTENAPEGENVTFSSPEGGVVTVTAAGAQDILASLTKEDVTVLMDLADLAPGAHDVPLEVTEMDGVTFSLSHETATVNIGDTEQEPEQAQEESPPPEDAETAEEQTEQNTEESA